MIIFFQDERGEDLANVESPTVPRVGERVSLTLTKMFPDGAVRWACSPECMVSGVRYELKYGPGFKTQYRAIVTLRELP